MSSPVSGSDVGKVGLATAIAIVVANMIGTGVFGSLGFQVAGIPSGFPILVLWLVGGIVSFCGAVCYAELASIFPKSGGESHLLSKAWNPFIGFLAGWLSVTVGFAAPVAANAALLGGYMGSITGLSPLWFGIPVVVLVAIVHLGKLSNIGLFQSGFTYAKVVLILVLGLLAFFLGTAQPISFLPAEGDGKLIASGGFAISLVYVLYAYTGWNAATYMMDEVRNPEKTVPLALLIGTALVTVLYLFINAAFLYSTPIEKISGQAEVGLIAAESILGAKGGMIMGILISFGLISTISSMTWAGPCALPDPRETEQERRARARGDSAGRDRPPPRGFGDFRAIDQLCAGPADDFLPDGRDRPRGAAPPSSRSAPSLSSLGLSAHSDHLRFAEPLCALVPDPAKDGRVSLRTRHARARRVDLFPLRAAFIGDEGAEFLIFAGKSSRIGPSSE